MKRTRLIAVLAGIVATVVFAADASAMYHPTLGRFTSRDPGPSGVMRMGAGGPALGGRFIPRDPTGSSQYADGMNLYQYVGSNPIKYLDPSGMQLCINPKDRKLEEIKQLIVKMAPAATFDCNQCVSLDKAESLPAKLVRELLGDAKHKFGIRSGASSNFDGNHMITISFTEKGNGYFTDAWDAKYPQVTRRMFPDDDVERAIVLGHEMIHAYYQKVKGRSDTALVDDSHVWANNLRNPRAAAGMWGTDVGRWREGEYYTTGLDVATAVDPKAKTVTVTTYTATYTENKLRQALGHKWRRAAYGVTNIRANPVDLSGYKITWVTKTR